MAVRSRYYTESPFPLFQYLDDIVAILGGTKMAFWPFLNHTGGDTYSYGLSNDDTYLAANTSTLELIFDPVKHPSGICSYMNNSATANLASPDNANYSHGDATVDTPFSIGAWILMQESLGTARSILAKYGSTATLREYDFRFTTAGKLVMELYDESADSTEIATSVGTALTPWIWQFVTMTYDGGETAPVINLYINATSVHDGSSAEAGAGYVAMEDTAAVLMVGARDAAATAAQVFQGRIALPFIVGKELSAAEVTQLYRLGKVLIGL